MRPLTATLTPAEVAALLDLTPATVEALLDSGRVLCHFKDGEPRIPLAELETLFRDAMIRLYRAEAFAVQPAQRLESVAAEPLGVEAPPPVHPDDAQAEMDPVEVATPPASVESRPAKLPDQRRTLRYVPRRQIDGIFDVAKFTILQISATGLRIRHRDPLLPGTEAKLTFSLIKPARSVVVRARVVWTSLARSGDEQFSISGLRAIEHSERLARAVDSLLATHDLQPERRVRNRRSDELILDGASDDEIAMVTAAMQKFAQDPVEASRWYARARFALSDEQVRRLAPPKPRDREEVLGIWEYLERQIELDKVASVVAWSRAAN